MFGNVTTLTIVDDRAETVSVEASTKVGDKVYRTTGTSKTAAPDRFDPVVGEEIALGRALRQLGRDLLKTGQSQVHEADKVRELQEQAKRRNAALRAARRPLLSISRPRIVSTRPRVPTTFVDRHAIL